MNYIIAEIQKDKTLSVIWADVPEDEIAKRVAITDCAYRNLVAIPHRRIEVASFDEGTQIEVEIKST